MRTGFAFVGAALVGLAGVVVEAGGVAPAPKALGPSDKVVVTGNVAPPARQDSGLSNAAGLVDVSAMTDSQTLASGPDFAVAVPGGAMTAAQGASAATVVATAVSGGFNAAIALSVSGLPAGVSATFAPATIAAPGAGSATLTLAASAAAPIGTYTVTVVGTGAATIRSATVSFTVAPYLPVPVTIYSDGFEGAFPGVWHVRHSGANAWWGSSTYRAFAGTHSVYCAGSGSPATPAGGPYPANMSGWMAYGPFSLENVSAAEATFKYWLKSQATNDTFQFMVSIDGLHFWGFKKSGSPSGWQSGTFNFDDALLPTSALGQPAVYFAFIFESDGATQLEGAYVDALTITKTVGGTPCVVTCTAASPAWGAPGSPVQFTGTINAASCSGSPAFAWSFADASPQSTVPSPAHAYASVGTYAWQMTASMGGQSCVKNGSIAVSAPPACTLSCNATVPAAWTTRTPVQFHAAAIATGCGSSPAFAWDLGDGAHAATADAAHTYATMGPRDWTLTVTAGTETCSKSGTVAIGQAVRRNLSRSH
jgi:PKD repeat protein